MSRKVPAPVLAGVDLAESEPVATPNAPLNSFQQRQYVILAVPECEDLAKQVTSPSQTINNVAAQL